MRAQVTVIAVCCCVLVALSAATTGQPLPQPSGQDDIQTVTLTRLAGQTDFGFSLSNVKQSLMVAEVVPGGAAAKAGLKFGDQVLTVNDSTPMGRHLARVHEWIASLESATLTYRRAPYTRRVVIRRADVTREFGFEVDDEAEVDMVYADTPAVRGGLMTDHVILAVNGVPTEGHGRVVVDLVTKAGAELELEVMPSNFYFPIMKNRGHEWELSADISDDSQVPYDPYKQEDDNDMYGSDADFDGVWVD